MQASIDIGNSRIKVGLFRNKEMLQAMALIDAELIEFLKDAKVEEIIVTSVAGKVELINSLKANFSFVLELARTTPLPIKSVYDTPETIGLDRMAAAIGALTRHAGPLLVIDAGTCITCDLINDQDTFIGGTISPGLQMRLKAMHTFTESLPLLELERPIEGIPVSTKTAMIAGTVLGAKHELIGFVNQYRLKYPDLKVIICGGDAKYFDKMFELNTFVLPNLVLEGLNAILRFNEQD